ncbi:hypothetical protein D3C87_1171340 [compost metagenome]
MTPESRYLLASKGSGLGLGIAGLDCSALRSDSAADNFDRASDRSPFNWVSFDSAPARAALAAATSLS